MSLIYNLTILNAAILQTTNPSYDYELQSINNPYINYMSSQETVYENDFSETFSINSLEESDEISYTESTTGTDISQQYLETQDELRENELRESGLRENELEDLMIRNELQRRRRRDSESNIQQAEIKKEDLFLQEIKLRIYRQEQKEKLRKIQELSKKIPKNENLNQHSDLKKQNCSKLHEQSTSDQESDSNDLFLSQYHLRDSKYKVLFDLLIEERLRNEKENNIWKQKYQKEVEKNKKLELKNQELKSKLKQFEEEKQKLELVEQLELMNQELKSKLKKIEEGISQLELLKHLKLENKELRRQIRLKIRGIISIMQEGE